MPPRSRRDALQRLRQITKERRALDAEEARLVATLRRYKEPWRMIGWALDVAPQTAHRKYGPPPARAHVQADAEVAAVAAVAAALDEAR